MDWESHLSHIKPIDLFFITANIYALLILIVNHNWNGIKQHSISSHILQGVSCLSQKSFSLITVIFVPILSDCGKTGLSLKGQFVLSFSVLNSHLMWDHSNEWYPLHCTKFLHMWMIHSLVFRVDYVDSLGRERRCLQKDLKHLQEMDKEMNAPKGWV